MRRQTTRAPDRCGVPGDTATRKDHGGRRRKGRLAFTIAVVTLAATAGAPPSLQAQSAEEEAARALQRLEYMVGSFRAERVEFLDEDGDVRRTSSAEARNDFQLDGSLLVHRGRLNDPVIETRGWYYWDQTDGALHLGSVSGSGRYDEFVGGWQDGRLIMEMLPNSAFPDRGFRMIHSDITDDSFLETLEMSEDGGRTWRPVNRQRMRRVGVTTADSAAAILEAMDRYAGHWRSEQKTGPDGDTFHFEYDLAWIDPGETITRMLITRIDAGGGTSVVFEGFKGREPSGEGVYYFAVSPSGRASRGEVFLDGGDLVTLYDGWTASGDVVRIRDVFEPVEGGGFVSRTFLRPSPEAEWRQIGEDHWTRVADGG